MSLLSDMYEVDDPNLDFGWLKLYRDRDQFLLEMKENGYKYVPDRHMFIKNFNDEDRHQLVARFDIDFRHFGELQGEVLFLEYDKETGYQKEVKSWVSQPMCDYDIMLGERLMNSSMKMIRDANKFVQRWIMTKKKMKLKAEAANGLKEQDG